MNFISEEDERRLGREKFEELKKKKKTQIVTKGLMYERLQRVGKRLQKVAPLENAEWEFVLFKDTVANAFCLPGGKVGVYTGLFTITKENEAWLATVLAHEVAHATLHHGAQNMSRAQVQQAMGTTGNAIMSASSIDSRAQLAVSLGFALFNGFNNSQYSQKDEFAADSRGLEYMAQAGYDPEKALNFWKAFSKYKQAKGRNTPHFFRTHPPDNARIENIRRLLPKVKNYDYRPRPKVPQPASSAKVGS
jgi:predicted Zn-dependent protease